MAKPEYDPVLNTAYARALYRRATVATLFGLLIGGAAGALLGGAGAFGYQFATSLRLTVHNFMPAINVEEATRLATRGAQYGALAAGLCGALLGLYRGSTAGLMYRLTAQPALGQLALARQHRDRKESERRPRRLGPSERS